MTEDVIVQPVILSGGSGSRLWPFSNAEKPKQFLSLVGERTMLQMTIERVPESAAFAPPIIVANAAHRHLIQAQVAAICVSPGALILEPTARNTAPAIALAALTTCADTPLLVMPSDHVIADVDGFRAAIRRALPLCRDGWLITFGITPHKAEVGFGYIERAEQIDEGVFRGY